MAPARFPVWRRERSNTSRQQLRNCALCVLLLLLGSLLIFLVAMYPRSLPFCRMQPEDLDKNTTTVPNAIHNIGHSASLEFDCISSTQMGPVVAHRIEKVDHPFFISLADLGTPEKPNRNFQRILKGKLFQKPAISETVQSLLEKLRASGFANGRPVVIDVGANVGMATFAAAAMQYDVLAFEPVLENVYKLCDGVYLNRVSSLVKLYHAAVSDSSGHITMHKVLGRLDNSAVSATGAKLAFKSNEVVPVRVRAVTLDSMLPISLPVLLLKIDVQGWEYHVLRGASELLSRPPHEAPYIIYEEDERLLQQSNSTGTEILQFLASHGYHFCSKEGSDRHCSKQKVS